ncbi:MAG: hypothetical protein RLZZ454_1680 [Pseudomonadota bacterium]
MRTRKRPHMKCSMRRFICIVRTHWAGAPRQAARLHTVLPLRAVQVGGAGIELVAFRVKGLDRTGL